MKRLMMAALVAVSMAGSMAMAFEGPAQLNDDGSVTLIPIQRNCGTTPQPASTDVIPEACNNGDTPQCPPYMNPVAKYCWGGWGEGFYRCGWSCRPEGGRGGDHGGGNGGSGGSGGGNGGGRH